jgi:PRC-barrel domain protein
LRLSLSLTEQIDAEVMMKSNRNKMTLLFTLPVIAILCTVLLTSTGPSPLRAQEVDLVVVDLQIVQKGYRASKLVGRTVMNDLNEKIGTLDEVIITKDHDIFMPIQVGGFLGVGSRLVVLPFDAFKIDESKIVLPNASREQLKKLAVYKYVS